MVDLEKVELDIDFYLLCGQIASNTTYIDQSLTCEGFEGSGAIMVFVGGLPIVHIYSDILQQSFMYNGKEFRTLYGRAFTRYGAILMLLVFFDRINVPHGDGLRVLEGIITINGNVISRGPDYSFSMIFPTDVDVMEMYWFQFAKKVRIKYGELIAKHITTTNFDQHSAYSILMYLIHMVRAALKFEEKSTQIMSNEYKNEIYEVEKIGPSKVLNESPSSNASCKYPAFQYYKQECSTYH